MKTSTTEVAFEPGDLMYCNPFGVGKVEKQHDIGLVVVDFGWNTLGIAPEELRLATQEEIKAYPISRVRYGLTPRQIYEGPAIRTAGIDALYGVSELGELFESWRNEVETDRVEVRTHSRHCSGWDDGSMVESVWLDGKPLAVITSSGKNYENVQCYVTDMDALHEIEKIIIMAQDGVEDVNFSLDEPVECYLYTQMHLGRDTQAVFDEKDRWRSVGVKDNTTGEVHLYNEP